MEDQVLSRDQMQELKELDIDTNYGSMYWHNYNTDSDPQWELCSSADVGDIATFTLQDILIMFKPLKGQWNLMDYGKGFEFNYFGKNICFSNSNILEAAFNMLKWCKKNGHL